MWALGTCGEPNEAKKNTHPGYITALCRDQASALSINEDKRNKEELVGLQARFEAWQGPSIAVACTRLVRDGMCVAMKQHKRLG